MAGKHKESGLDSLLEMMYTEIYGEVDCGA
jgi:hypothetical protein